MNSDARSILLVDDNPMDVDLALRAFKRRAAVQVQVARDGEEALAWMARWEGGEPWPAVILLDLKLPRVGGLEVLRRLKQHPALCVIPVAVLTTSNESADVQTAYQLGANSYIVKPVDFEQFIDLSEHIERYWTVVNHKAPEAGRIS
jgi:CheY-like chemotaxis protein